MAMTGDPLLTRAHHADVFACGEGESSYEDRGDIVQQLQFSTSGSLDRSLLFNDRCKADFFLLLGQARAGFPIMVGPLATWQPLQGFPITLWPLDDETLAPSVLTCRVPSHQAPMMETVSEAHWHLSVTHKSTTHTCPLAQPPYTHAHTQKSPLAHQQPPVSLSLTNTHFPPPSCPQQLLFF